LARADKGLWRVRFGGPAKITAGKLPAKGCSAAAQTATGKQLSNEEEKWL